MFAIFDWQVFVNKVGYIGMVEEDTEGLARLAALHKFGKTGTRSNNLHDKVIYEDDDFMVCKVAS